MIETADQYSKAQAELRQLEVRLQRIQAENPPPADPPYPWRGYPPR